MSGSREEKTRCLQLDPDRGGAGGGAHNDPVSLFEDPWGAVGRGAGVQHVLLNPTRPMGLASDLSALSSTASSGFQMWPW